MHGRGRTLTMTVALTLALLAGAFPLTAPGSLRPEETYSLVAYLLAENQIIDRATVIDARSLPRIRASARARSRPFTSSKLAQ